MDEKLTAREILERYPNKFSLTTLWRLSGGKAGELPKVLPPCGRIGKKTRVWRQSAIERYLTRYEPETISD